MPNHIESRLILGGDKKQIKKLQETIQSNKVDEENGKAYFMPIDFEKVIPMPDDLFKGNLGEAEKKKYGKHNWYDWSVDNWGTKWNAYDMNEEVPEIIEPSNALRFRKDEGSFVITCYHFNTAWSPVPKVIAKLSEMFPDIIMRYSYVDEGGGFAGYDYYKEGEILEEHDVTGNAREEKKLLKEQKPEVFFKEFGRVIKEHL